MVRIVHVCIEQRPPENAVLHDQLIICAPKFVYACACGGLCEKEKRIYGICVYMCVRKMCTCEICIRLRACVCVCVRERPGGGALRYRGDPHPRYVFRGRRGLF